ncbi:MAG: WG repeat-containing protein [Bacteroidota bacterium]
MLKFFKLLLLLCAVFTSTTRSYGIEYQIFEESGRVGLKDEEGEILIPAVYEDLGWSNDLKKPIKQVIGFQSNGLWGLISLENKQLVSPLYSRLYPFTNNLLAAARKGKVSGFDYFGVINLNGKVAVPFKYSSVKPGKNSAIVTAKNRVKISYGVVTLSGEVIIPIRYKDVSLKADVYAVTNFDDKTALYGSDGSSLTEFIYTSVQEIAPRYLVVEHMNAFGLFSGTELVKPTIYKTIYSDGNEIYLQPYNTWEILNIKKEKLRSYDFDDIQPFNENYLVRSNHKTWIMDQHGRALTDPSAEDLIFHKSGFIAIKQSSGWGLIDRKFKSIINPVYDSLYMDAGLVFCRNSYSTWSILDTLGLKKSEFQYEQIGNKTRYFWPVKRRGHWGFIEQSGEEIIYPVYDHVGRFISNKVVVGFHGEEGIIDKKGEWVVLPSNARLTLLTDDLYINQTHQLKTLKSIDRGTVYFTENPLEIKKDYLLETLSDGGIWKIDFNGRIENNLPRDERFEEVKPPSEGLFAVKIDGLYGFIDRQNHLIIANRYDDVGAFNEGFAPFKLIGKWGFIDKKENIIVQPLYNEVSAFKNGVAIVREGNRYFLLNKKGKLLNSTGYDSIVPTEDGLFITQIRGLHGLMDRNGRLLINNRYQKLDRLKNGYVITEKNDRFGLITNEGVDVIPAVYDQLIYDAYRDEYMVMKKTSPLKAALR